MSRRSTSAERKKYKKLDNTNPEEIKEALQGYIQIVSKKLWKSLRTGDHVRLWRKPTQDKPSGYFQTGGFVIQAPRTGKDDSWYVVLATDQFYYSKVNKGQNAGASWTINLDTIDKLWVKANPVNLELDQRLKNLAVRLKELEKS